MLNASHMHDLRADMLQESKQTERLIWQKSDIPTPTSKMELLVIKVGSIEHDYRPVRSNGKLKWDISKEILEDKDKKWVRFKLTQFVEE